MAATALVIVMNATFEAAADAVPFVSADLNRLTLTFSSHSKISASFLCRKLELTSVHYDDPCIFSVPC